MSIDAHLREGNENGLKIRNSFLLAKKAKEAPNFSKSFFFSRKKANFCNCLANENGISNEKQKKKCKANDMQRQLKKNAFKKK